MREFINRAKRFGSLLIKTFRQWIEREPFNNSIIIAYYTIFSLPGLLIIIINIAGYFFGTESVTKNITGQIDPKFTILAFCALVLVIFQGWIGSFVVSSNLTPWTITVHMFLALLLVALLIFLIHWSSGSDHLPSSLGFWWLMASMALLLVQTLLGTQVREALDHIADDIPREFWIREIEGGAFSIHRSFSWIVLLVHVGLIIRLHKTHGLKAFPLTLILLILGTILTGVGMAYFAVPPFLQPLHLLLATVTFGVQFLFLLKLNKSIFSNS